MNKRTSSLALLAAGIGIALLLTLASPFASSHPDGLEKVAEDQGFLGTAKDAPYEIIPGYAIPGIDNERLATILAGMAGVLIVAGLALLLARILSRGASSGEQR